MAQPKISVKIGANTAGLKSGIAEAKGAINDLAKSVNAVEASLAGIGAMTALAGPIKAAQDWAAAVNDLEDKTNMAGEAASRLLAVGQHVGLSTDEMSAAVMKMTKSAYDSAAALGSTSDVFTKWGIQITDTNGELLSAEQILKNVAAVHRDMANGVQKNAMEMEIFGRSGGKLNDILNLTEDQMNAVAKHAEDVGLVMSHEVSQAFEDAQFKVNDAKMALQGMAVSIGSEMLPELQNLCDWLNTMCTHLATSEDGTRRNIAVFAEAVGGLGALAVAVNGAAAAYNFLAGAAEKAAHFIGMVAKAAGSTAGVAMSFVGGAVYSAYKDFQHYAKGGGFTYEEGRDEVMQVPIIEEADSFAWGTPAGADLSSTAPSGGGGAGGGGGRGGGGGGSRAVKKQLEEEKNLYTEYNQLKKDMDKALHAEQAKEFQDFLDSGKVERMKDIEDEIKQRKEALQQRLKDETEYEQLRREMETTMRQGSYDEFMAFLNSEKEQRLLALEEEREQRQQLLDWKKEAEQSFLSFAAGAADTVKNDLANGLAACITQGKTLASVFLDIGKNIISMFVQYMVKKTAAAALDKMLGKTMQKESAAQAAATTSAWSSAAMARSIAELGPVAGPAAYATAMAAGTIASTVGSLSSVMSGQVETIQMATGGIVTGPTMAMIGEGHSPEMVLPLNDEGLEKVGMGGMSSPNFTINVSAVDADGVAAFFQRNGAALVDSLQNQARKFNFGGAY